MQENKLYPKSYSSYKYSSDVKTYVRDAVKQRFSNINIPLEEFLAFAIELNKEILKLLTKLNFPVTQEYVDIFYQMSMVYIMDRIKIENFDTNEIIPDIKMQYDNLVAKAYFGKYDISWFPSGLYILPKILTDKISNRLITLVYYLLRDDKNSIRFSLTGTDNVYGDMCPRTLFCIYKSIYDTLRENFILLFEKEKLLITSVSQFSINRIDPLTQEIIVLFTRDVKVKIDEHSLSLPSGSIIVLNKEAISKEISITALDNSIVYVFY